MVSFNYAKSAATADRLIKKFGQTGAIRRTTTTGDPWDPVVTETDYACTLVVTEYTLRERESSLIGTTDKRVLISTKDLSIEPTEQDRVVVGGIAHEIVRVDPLNPGGTVVMWEAQCVF